MDPNLSKEVKDLVKKSPSLYQFLLLIMGIVDSLGYFLIGFSFENTVISFLFLMLMAIIAGTKED